MIIRIYRILNEQPQFLAFPRRLWKCCPKRLVTSFNWIMKLKLISLYVYVYTVERVTGRLNKMMRDRLLQKSSTVLPGIAFKSTILTSLLENLSFPKSMNILCRQALSCMSASLCLLLHNERISSSESSRRIKGYKIPNVPILTNICKTLKAAMMWWSDFALGRGESTETRTLTVDIGRAFVFSSLLDWIGVFSEPRLLNNAGS